MTSPPSLHSPAQSSQLSGDALSPQWPRGFLGVSRQVVRHRQKVVCQIRAGRAVRIRCSASKGNDVVFHGRTKAWSGNDVSHKKPQNSTGAM